MWFKIGLIEIGHIDSGEILIKNEFSAKKKQYSF